MSNRIVCAACRKRDVVIVGAGHFDDVMRRLMFYFGGAKLWGDCEQGFIDNRGNFLNRKEAYKNAKENDQIIHLRGSEHTEELYSENLY